MKEPWFGAKTYGIGVSPKSPAGWLSLLAYAAAIMLVIPLGRHFQVAPPLIGLAMLALTVGLILLAVVKGDHRPWRWRWGGR